MGAQLCAAVGRGALGFVAQARLTRSLERLWDSRRPLAHPRPARAGVFARSGVNLWDSHTPKNQAITACAKKILNNRLARPSEFLRKTGGFYLLSGAMA